jgi:hypothetical protein
MRPQLLKAVNLGWESTFFVCYFYWSLERFRLVDAGMESAVTNQRAISLTYVVCKHLEHGIAAYLRQVWEKNDWLYEREQGFTPGYSCEIQVIISGLFGRWSRYRDDYNRLFQ